MQINKINNISTNFKGLLRLDSSISYTRSGFPNGPDFTDIFEYTPFRDESPEDLEADQIKLKELESYYVADKVDENQYTIRQTDSTIHKRAALGISHDEFNPRNLNKRIKDQVIDLSTVPAGNMQNAVNNVKNKSIRTILEQFDDGSLRYQYF